MSGVKGMKWGVRRAPGRQRKFRKRTNKFKSLTERYYFLG